MAFSQVGIVNMSLGRIGVKRIASMTEDSAQAIAANAVYEYILKEVLEVKDWRFAKERVALAKNATAPANKYLYAYTLPSDFLRIAASSVGDPAVYPTGAYSTSYQTGRLEIVGTTFAYVIENISDDTLCLFTDYDNDAGDLFLTYIRYITNTAKFTASFVSAFAFRLAAELCLQLTESKAKYDSMITLYERALLRADSLNMSMDYLENETGSTELQDAGR